MIDRQPADRDDRTRFGDADGERFERALGVALAKLTPAERLLGKVDGHGDVIWGGCPSAMFKPETVPWLHRIVVDPDVDPAADACADADVPDDE